MLIKLEHLMQSRLRAINTGLSIIPLVVAIFYLMAAFEVDPGDLGDSFGDVYDTYVTAQSVDAPSHQLVVGTPILPVPPLFVTLVHQAMPIWAVTIQIVEPWLPPPLTTQIYLLWQVLRL